MKRLFQLSSCPNGHSISFGRLYFGVAVLAVSAIAVQGACLAAGIDFGGKSLASELPFVNQLAATAQDLLFTASKVVGAILAFVGLKNASQRNWEHALPAFGGGAALFFLPQIVTALSTMAGK